MPRKAHNSRFSAVLEEIIHDDFHGIDAELARASGMSPSLVSYYRRPGDSGRFPTTPQLERLIAPMSESAQRKLVSAFIYDQIPANARHLVGVKHLAEGKKPQTPLPREVEAVIQDFRERAATSNHFKQWILATGAALRGE